MDSGRPLCGPESQGDQFVLDGDPLSDRMQPVENVHRGPVVAFVDGATASAAVEMVAALRASRPDVRLIGEETQGGCAGHVGEMPIAYALSSSEGTAGVTVLMSMIEITQVATEGCVPGHGFEPDVSVTYTLDDFLMGRDPYAGAL